MSKKSFKIARKPGQGNGTQSTAATPASASKTRTRRATQTPNAAANTTYGPTTRKTIEVPEDYFKRVKLRAVERGILEKELWAEIVVEYFENHPAT